MPPIREYLCDYCGHQFEELMWTSDPDEYRHATCRCGSKATVLPAVIGGVNGTMLSAARPKNSGAMKSKKAYTTKPDENVYGYEPTEEPAEENS